MTLDTSAMVTQWREAIARGGHRAYSIPVVEMVALCDALDEMRTERDSWQADVESLHRDLAHQMDRIAEEMAAVEAERERVRVLREALQWYADERNYDEIGRPGVYVPGSTAGGFVQDPDWDTDDGWRAERALEAALATAGGEGATGALWAE